MAPPDALAVRQQLRQNAVHRHDVPGTQECPNNRDGEQRFASQEIDGALDAGADQGWIQETGMVAGQNDRIVQGHPFGMIDAPPEITGEREAKQSPEKAITWVQIKRSLGKKRVTGGSCRPSFAVEFPQ